MIAFRVPLKRSFRGVKHRQGLLIEGPEGFGEYSPFPGFRSDDALELCFKAAVSASSEPLPPPLRDSVPVTVTVPDSLDPVEAEDFVRASGCSAAKVKCTGSATRDERLIEAVREALGPKGKLRIDANSMWSVDEAVKRIRILDGYGLEMVEQPVASIEDLAEVRRRVDVPIAIDEGLEGLDGAMLAVNSQACDVLVLKVQYMGGISECIRIAESTDVPIVVSSAIETSVGLSIGVAFAASLESLPYACGLGTAELLEGDLTHHPLTPIKGMVEVRRVSPDPDLMDRFRIDVAEVAIPQTLGSGQ